MPISEDELDHKTSSRQHHTYHRLVQISHQQVSGMSKAEQRRSNKPIMEKRRRARINHCLNELKSLILDAMKKDPARHSKLEKADILEMTVKHLQNVQRQQLAVAVATDPTVLHKFRTGFNECAGEVSRYIGRIEGVDPTVRSRLLAHLASCVSGLHQLTPFSFGAMAAVAATPPPPPSFATHHVASSAMPPDEGSLTGGRSSTPVVASSSGDVNNNQSGRENMTVGIVPGLLPVSSRLPAGELALLLSGSGRVPSDGEAPSSFPSSGSLTPSLSACGGTSSSGNPSGHHSAFTAVARVSSPPLPPGGAPLSPAPSPSSSCASTSCDSFPSSSPASGPRLPPAEAPKFSYCFSSSTAEARHVPPPASLLHARAMEVEDRGAADETRLPISDSGSKAFDLAPSLLFSGCPPTSPPPGSLLPDSLLPRPLPLFLPSSLSREVLDFSVKRERGVVAEGDAGQSPRAKKRANSDEFVSEDATPSAKMAKLQVEELPLKEGKGCLSVEVISDECSSAVFHPPIDESTALDMWRPW